MNFLTALDIARKGDVIEGRELNAFVLESRVQFKRRLVFNSNSRQLLQVNTNYLNSALKGFYSEFVAVKGINPAFA